MASKKTIHFNKPQLRVMAINARETYFVGGRALGKSQGILAPHDFRCMQLMPRGCGMLIGSNYRKMLTDLLPPYIAGLERLGMVRDRDFVIGDSELPRKLGWKDPYIAPDRTVRKFFIHTKWGSGIRLASQDRRVTLNGTEVDWIKGDEAKLLNFERYKKEILPTNRGREQLWSHLPEHHSILFCTDKLFDRKGGSWIMQQKNRMDPILIESILQIQAYLWKVKEQYEDEMPEEVERKVKALTVELQEAQALAVAFEEADTLENVHALGWNFIMQMKRNLSEQEFDVAILNKDNVQIEGSFYPNLDYEQHGYDANDYSRIDDLNFDIKKLRSLDSTFDEDCNTTEPLEIGIDWGGTMNGMVICQSDAVIMRCINAIYVKPPETFKDLARAFTDYYRFHKNKEVIMYYDPYGNNARADSNETYAEEFERMLTASGWTVTMMNTGTTNPHHHDKFLLWQTILSEQDPRFPKYRMNTTHCQNVWTSMMNAPVKQGTRGFEKDKSSERKNSGTLPEHATHFSDMIDLVIWFKYSQILKGTQIFSSDSLG